MSAGDPLPALAGDFGLVPIAERLLWREAFSRHLLDKMALPEWKKDEQVEPLILTIACLVQQGITDPRTISTHILHLTSR
jgi:hypothetical protein